MVHTLKIIHIILQKSLAHELNFPIKQKIEKNQESTGVPILFLSRIKSGCLTYALSLTIKYLTLMKME